MSVKTKQQDTTQAESEPVATILFPVPPDYSCEIEKPLRYVDYIADVMGERSKGKGVASITLTIDEVETFMWMLRDAGTVIHKMNEDFYGDDGWNDFWWKNREKLESCGIKMPWWSQIENSRNTEQQGRLQ